MNSGPEIQHASQSPLAVFTTQPLAAVKAPSPVLPSELTAQFSVQTPGHVRSVEVSSIAQADSHLKQGFVALCWRSIKAEERAPTGDSASLERHLNCIPTHGVEIYSYSSSLSEQPRKLEIPALADRDVQRCFFDRLGTTLFIVDSKGDIASIDLTNPNAEVKLPFGRARFLERSKDASLIAVVTRDESGNNPAQKLIKHQTDNSEWVTLLKSNTASDIFAFSPDGSKIAAVQNGMALVFDRHNLGTKKGLLETRVLLLEEEPKHLKVHKIVFSPDGQSMAILEGRRSTGGDASVRDFTIHLRRLDDADFNPSIKCGTSFSSAPPQFALGTNGELFVSSVKFTGEFRPSLTQLLRSFVTFSADGKSRAILNDATLELSTSRSGDIIAVLPDRLHLKALSVSASHDGAQQSSIPVMCKIVTLPSDFVHQDHVDSSAPNYLAAQTESFTFAALTHRGDRLVTVSPGNSGSDVVSIFS